VDCFEVLYWEGVSAFPYHGVYLCSWCVIWCIQVASPVTFCFRNAQLVHFCWIRCCKHQPICKHFPSAYLLVTHYVVPVSLFYASVLMDEAFCMTGVV
jgi:hypothetical protein